MCIRDRGDGSTQRGKIMPARHCVVLRQRWRQRQRGTGCLRGQCVHRKAIARGHHLVARAGKHLCELHQQLVRAVAQQDVAGIHPMMLCQGAFEIAAQGVWIHMRRAQRSNRRLRCRRACTCLLYTSRCV